MEVYMPKKEENVCTHPNQTGHKSTPTPLQTMDPTAETLKIIQLRDTLLSQDTPATKRLKIEKKIRADYNRTSHYKKLIRSGRLDLIDKENRELMFTPYEQLEKAYYDAYKARKDRDDDEPPKENKQQAVDAKDTSFYDDEPPKKPDPVSTKENQLQPQGQQQLTNLLGRAPPPPPLSAYGPSPNFSATLPPPQPASMLPNLMFPSFWPTQYPVPLSNQPQFQQFQPPPPQPQNSEQQQQQQQQPFNQFQAQYYQQMLQQFQQFQQLQEMQKRQQ